MPEETFGDACQKTGGKIMTKLDCSVTGCMHNAENCCCKGGTFRNLFKTPESRLEVECEATNCVYNTDRRCSAEHIGITGGNATVSMQTECSSFQKR